MRLALAVLTLIAYDSSPDYESAAANSNDRLASIRDIQLLATNDRSGSI
jgi:hypothetical protein